MKTYFITFYKINKLIFNNMKNEKLIICGKSASGKNFLLNEMVNTKKMKAGIKTTTRPPRLNEENGIDYNFLSKEEFDDQNLIVKESFYVEPKDSDPTYYHYGYSEKEFESSQVFIMTPGEIEMLPESIRKECFVVYLDIPHDIRESRLISRDDNNDSIRRRMRGDDKDFKDFEDYDLRIGDPDFSSEMVYDLMD